MGVPFKVQSLQHPNTVLLYYRFKFNVSLSFCLFYKKKLYLLPSFFSFFHFSSWEMWSSTILTECSELKNPQKGPSSSTCNYYEELLSEFALWLSLCCFSVAVIVFLYSKYFCLIYYYSHQSCCPKGPSVARNHREILFIFLLILFSCMAKFKQEKQKERQGKLRWRWRIVSKNMEVSYQLCSATFVFSLPVLVCTWKHGSAEPHPKE